MGNCGSVEDEQETKLVETLGDHTDCINSFAVSSDGTILVTASEDQTARLWSTNGQDTECLGVLVGHTDYINSVAISGTSVITGSADGSVRKWDMATCECLFVYEGHTARVQKLMIVENNIVSCSYDGTVKAWVLDTSAIPEGFEQTSCIRTFKGHGKSIYAMIFIPAEAIKHTDDADFDDHIMMDLVITGSADFTARAWDYDTGKCLRIFKGHTGSITTMAVDSSGRTLYTAGADSIVMSWNISTGQALKTMGGHSSAILCLVLSNRFLYTGSVDTTSKCWLADYGDCTRTYRGHKHSIICMKLEYGWLFTGCGDGNIRSYDPRTGELMRTYRGHRGPVNCMVIIGDRMYSGSTDGTLRRWDLKDIREEALFGAENEEFVPPTETQECNVMLRPASNIRHLLLFREAEKIQSLAKLEEVAEDDLNFENIIDFFNERTRSMDDKTVGDIFVELMHLELEALEMGAINTGSRISHIIGLLATWASSLPKSSRVDVKAKGGKHVEKILKTDESAPDWCKNTFFPQTVAEIEALVLLAKEQGKALLQREELDSELDSDDGIFFSLLSLEQLDPLHVIRTKRSDLDMENGLDKISVLNSTVSSGNDGIETVEIKVMSGATFNDVADFAARSGWRLPYAVMRHLKTTRSLGYTVRSNKHLQDQLLRVEIVSDHGTETVSQDELLGESLSKANIVLSCVFKAIRGSIYLFEGKDPIEQEEEKDAQEEEVDMEETDEQTKKSSATDHISIWMSGNDDPTKRLLSIKEVEGNEGDMSLDDRLLLKDLKTLKSLIAELIPSTSALCSLYSEPNQQALEVSTALRKSVIEQFVEKVVPVGEYYFNLDGIINFKTIFDALLSPECIAEYKASQNQDMVPKLHEVEMGLKQLFEGNSWILQACPSPSMASCLISLASPGLGQREIEHFRSFFLEALEPETDVLYETEQNQQEGQEELTNEEMEEILQDEELSMHSDMQSIAQFMM